MSEDIWKRWRVIANTPYPDGTDEKITSSQLIPLIKKLTKNKETTRISICTYWEKTNNDKPTEGKP